MSHLLEVPRDVDAEPAPVLRVVPDLPPLDASVAQVLDAHAESRDLARSTISRIEEILAEMHPNDRRPEYDRALAHYRELAAEAERYLEAHAH